MYKDFLDQNCEVILILGENVEKAKKYVESLHLPFPVLADPGREIYHLYGLEKAYVFLQRTASIVIDTKGVIRYVKTTSSPMVWLQEIKDLLGVVQSIAKPA